MLSDIYFDQKKYPESINVLKKANNVSQSNAEIHRRLSNSYYWQNNYKLAIDEVNIAIRLNRSLNNYLQKFILYIQKYFFIFVPIFILLMVLTLLTTGAVNLLFFGLVILFIISLLVYYLTNRFLVHGIGTIIIMLIVIILECLHLILK
jgi:tetratricopeptide (TPR) repeat protein